MAKVKRRKARSNITPKIRRSLAPRDYGCPECNNSDNQVPVIVRVGRVICTNCGLEYTWDEYFDYIQKKLKELV